jgi:signal transduction histidine kinase
LRTTLANETGLISAIDEYLNEFGIQTHIRTRFNNEVEGPLYLASLAEVQLVCILREALTNVRKHAQADCVTVQITQKMNSGEHDYLLMEVADDGVGFVGNSSTRSFGLQTMHERADAVGGKLTVQSAPGKGTSIMCLLPCLQEENLRKPNLMFQ